LVLAAGRQQDAWLHSRPPQHLPTEGNILLLLFLGSLATIACAVPIARRVPEGWTFHDVMEEYVVGPNGQGRWQPITKVSKPKGGGRKQRDAQSDSD
jgi:hypothetical protein